MLISCNSVGQWNLLWISGPVKSSSLLGRTLEQWFITWWKCFVLVLQSLVGLIHEPEPEHPLRADLAEEFTKDKKKFNKNAEEWTKKFSERRPTD